MEEEHPEAANEAKVAKPPPTQVQIQATPSWRQLSLPDIPRLARIAAKIHPALPESDAVFAERVTLFPAGCLGLVGGGGKGGDNDDEICGYVISHPIRRRRPPALNRLLAGIAADADQYYIHDLVILPGLRGRGFARECIIRLFAIARRYPTTCLISVYGTEQSWSRFGFVAVQIDDVLEEKLLGYGDDAIYLERENEEYQS